MDRVRRLIYSEFGSIIMSIVLGLGLATLFRKVCKDRNCMKFVGPSIKKTKGSFIKKISIASTMGFGLEVNVEISLSFEVICT